MIRTLIAAVAAILLITTAAQAEPAYHVIIKDSIGCVTLNKEALQLSAGVRSGTLAELKPVDDLIDANGCRLVASFSVGVLVKREGDAVCIQQSIKPPPCLWVLSDRVIKNPRNSEEWRRLMGVSD